MLAWCMLCAYHAQSLSARLAVLVLHAPAQAPAAVTSYSLLGHCWHSRHFQGGAPPLYLPPPAVAVVDCWEYWAMPPGSVEEEFGEHCAEETIEEHQAGEVVHLHKI